MMNGKGGAGKKEERINTSCCQYWGGRQGRGSHTRGWFCPSGISAVSLSSTLVQAFLTSCQGKTLGFIQVSPACFCLFNQAMLLSFPEPRASLWPIGSSLTLQHNTRAPSFTTRLLKTHFTFPTINLPSSLASLPQLEVTPELLYPSFGFINLTETWKMTFSITLSSYEIDALTNLD